MRKINVGVVFGGKSAEHEVSQMSATSVINAIDKEKYNIVPIGITKDGKWKRYNGETNLIEDGGWKLAVNNNDDDVFAIISNKDKEVLSNQELGDTIDVIFPILHGPMGEDGTVQGMFETLDVPYVGAGVLASALCMDKAFAKTVFESQNLKVARCVLVLKHKVKNELDRYVQECEDLGYPLFVKPANLGSSVGITKAHDREELVKGLEEALEYDRRVLVEEFIDGREIECAVLGNDHPKASVLGEIIPSHEFYDYESKYFDDGKSKLIIPANVDKELSDKIRAIAVDAYMGVDCTGLARVDFFLEKETNEIYINEINTMPGFTRYSMYPLLWKETGLGYSELIDELIQLAIDRYDNKNKML